MNLVTEQLSEEELRQYRRDIQDWSADQLREELTKLYIELSAGILPQAAYDQAKQLLETQLYGTLYDTTDEDYNRAMKGI